MRSAGGASELHLQHLPLILKIGKAKSEDVMADGSNRRAHTSARKAQKAGYPDAVSKPVKDLGYTTTADATKEEAKMVRGLREQGHELPLNRERGKAYKKGYP